MRDVRLLFEDFPLVEPLETLAGHCPESGGIASYCGTVRRQGVLALELQHYEPLTLPGMQDLAGSACARFALDGLIAWHRVGRIPPAGRIVLVAAAARHRRQALQAVDYVMDHLKSAAWFWKREQRADGWHWIDPRADDHGDIARWADPQRPG